MAGERELTSKPDGIYGNGENSPLSRNAQQLLLAILTIGVLFFMAIDITGPEVIFFIALMVLCLAQILTITETLAGFSNESMITIGTLFLVIGVVEKSHVVDWFARKAFGANGPPWWGKLRMYCTCFALSGFFNNTPLVAILMPVVKDWGRLRGIAASQLLIPLSYSVLAGSFCTMIGTSTNLTIAGLLKADRDFTFPFFAPFPVGAVCFVALTAYQMVAAPYLLPQRRSGLLREARDHCKDHIAEVYVSRHSFAVGGSLSHMMNSLAIAPKNCFKIRRRVEAGASGARGAGGGGGGGGSRGTPTGGLFSRSGRASPNNSSTESLDVLLELHLEAQQLKEARQQARLTKIASARLDKTYLANSAKFWFDKPPDLPDRLDIPPVTQDGAPPPPPPTEEEEEDAPDSSDVEQPSPADEYFDIIAPDLNETIHAGDIVFVSSAQDAVEKMMTSIMGESRGLFILKGNVLSLPGFGTELVECVVSDSNPFIGTKVSDIAPLFAETYKAGLITVRGKNWDDTPLPGSPQTSKAKKKRGGKGHEKEEDEVEDDGVSSEDVVVLQDEDDDDNADLEKKEQEAADDGVKMMVKPVEVTVSDLVLAYGDTILCVTKRKHVASLQENRDFFVVSTVGSLPVPLNRYSFLPVVIFVAMLVVVAFEFIDMCPAALATTAVFFAGGWLKPKDIPKLVNVKLLMLMGCALSYSTAISKTGLADRVANSIMDADPSNYGAIMLVYIITLLFTETISNNAAAAIMYPIAVSLADELKVSFKPFAMTVLVASTSCFMTPLGYQTHTMVWGPGGYMFRDYLRYGFACNLIYWVLGCAVIVQIYPLTSVDPPES